MGVLLYPTGEYKQQSAKSNNQDLHIIGQARVGLSWEHGKAGKFYNYAYRRIRPRERYSGLSISMHN